MNKALLALGAGLASLLAGCNPFAEGLKKTNAEERERNRTLTKAALVMKEVERWSASHGGALPNATQFREEVPAPPPPNTDWNFTADELKEAKSAFAWSFNGGKAADPEQIVGRLSGPQGASVAFANGKVNREELAPKGSS